jgi:hypothetical protein
VGTADVSNFCETNVRTYVRDRAGRSGIWFFSLDASRLGAVVTARATPYRLRISVGTPIAPAARAAHQPWPLYRAQASVVEDRLLITAGLPAPEGEPLVHYSPGVDVAIGRPEF